jgi:hypothetical protein
MNGKYAAGQTGSCGAKKKARKEIAIPGLRCCGSFILREEEDE